MINKSIFEVVYECLAEYEADEKLRESMTTAELAEWITNSLVDRGIALPDGAKENRP